MDWVVVLALTWLVVALAVGCVIGRGIHLADQREGIDASRGRRMIRVVDNYVAEPDHDAAGVEQPEQQGRRGEP